MMMVQIGYEPERRKERFSGTRDRGKKALAIKGYTAQRVEDNI